MPVKSIMNTHGITNMHYEFDDKNLNSIRIAVVIVNYNSAQYLIRALAALEQQSLAPVEVIVLDNASSEAIPPDLLTSKLPIKLIETKTNLGFAGGNNHAFKFLDESINWIALLNPDAYPEPDWLKELAKTILAHPEYQFMGSKLLIDSNPELLDGTGDAYHISGKAWRINHQKPLLCDPAKRIEIFSPCAAAAIYRRDIIEKVSGFDEHFFCYYEDIDLAFRLRLLGYRACYVPTSIARHTGSATTKRHSDFYTYHGHRNLVWTYLKNMPGLLLIISLPLHILLNVLTIIIFTLRGQGKTIIKAKKDALLGIGTIYQQRKTLQRQRVISNLKVFELLKKGLPW